MSELPTFTAADVATHKTKDDLWVNIHDKVYNVTDYVRDHPGGADILVDVAGTDASAEYDDVGHSEDADEILASYLVGTSADAGKTKRAKAVKLVQQTIPSAVPAVAEASTSSTILKAVAGTVVVAASAYCASTYGPAASKFLSGLPIPQVPAVSAPQSSSSSQTSFVSGFAVASAISAVAAGMAGKQLSKFTHIESGFMKYPPRRKPRGAAKPVNPHLVKGFLDPKEYQALPVIRIDKLSSNVYRYVFKLPGPRDVIGLPIGQHVAIKATVDGKTVTRSYTPVSNNLDLGVLELVIKVYPDGALTGKYFANLKVGDEVLFRGPKGAMRYQRGLCKKIGMIAGGTGITPMYQLIRAICEDERDTTEISLILANRAEDDILLRAELESFARRYPKNLKLWYMLDNPPDAWAYGKGFVTSDVIKEKLPPADSDTKIMLCGPPGMINASKKALVSLGFKEPGAVSKMTDQIFSF
ncbi:hypothetical protein BS50DRAFT_681221 [Corynespora cassiicola Philippines]|uniref:Cytochrome-b5 reductase n=1 Tax=Corynespora cassiicola Philippines TaxID=1448308 RepID=A0A2T2N6E4_CORCC|nr:hypothetical protein BS50DRAFT_681221 [Corynespora cassiicola Philippines]